MLKIALCDDRAEDLARTAQLLRTYCAQRPAYAPVLQVYSSPLPLLSEIERGDFHDIYLLDILMPGFSGLQLGQAIRRRNRVCAIIFGTVTSEYALDSYGLQAQNYLVKPFRTQTLFDALDQAAQCFADRQAAGLSLRCAQGYVFLPYHQILFVELAARRPLFHLRDGRCLAGLKLRGTFEAALAGLLAEKRFLQTHKSFVANMDCIQRLGPRELLLDGGLRVPVSVRRRGAVTARYLSHRARQAPLQSPAPESGTES